MMLFIRPRASFRVASTRKSILKQAVLLLSLTIPAWSQVSTGTIVGAVRDASGAMIAKRGHHHHSNGHKGTARNTNQQHWRVQRTVSSGRPYSIKTVANGFETKTLTGINLQVDQTVNLQITMDVGSINQSVEVTASTPLVDSVTSSLGRVVENKQILDMPWKRLRTVRCWSVRAFAILANPVRSGRMRCVRSST